jgi:hypothetical protein
MHLGKKRGECRDNAELTAPGMGVHIGFSTTGGWLSRIIRKMTAAPVSHCFLVFHSEAFGKDMVLEASGRGFRMMSWRRFDRGNKLVAMYRLNLPEQKQREAFEQLGDRLGDAYDTLSLFGFLLRKWFRLKRTPFDSRDKLICSEVVALFLEWAGVPFDDIGVVTPRDLLELAGSRPDAFLLVDKDAGFDRVAARAARRHARRQRRKGAPVANPTAASKDESSASSVG